MLRKLLVVLVLATGCSTPPGSGGLGGGSAGAGGGDGGGLAGGAGGGGGGGAAEIYAVSSKAQVRFKRNERLGNDIAKSLGLTAATVCNELGAFACTSVVHPIPLGGVAPYTIGLYDPVPYSAVTSPIVVDRVALAACTQRVVNDLETPASAFIFKGVTVDGAGKLTAPTGAEVNASLDLLYKQVLLRPPTAAELAYLKQLYLDVVAKGKPEPGRAWMTLACFAVVSSVESVFY